ncbi:class I SAM-dependent methyltransferase [Streptomyces sp. ISL-43]|uniref:class I SAM-dependent methyltransferase n=1 Tax=Streptomyces sp. ISL-43 TaxID=2819183 RepID=UPI001BECB2BC|nr:class I SAM-dependent methyltransferase [Streptomyces sp. ISL-43]MBT2452809.1 class I SAM-dependent methyltransferase [Streptomyces sp. ISL-43]
MEHVVNTDQAQAWNGYEGTQWARNQDRWDAVNDGFNRPLLDAAAIGTRERVLDVGCGAGRTTRLAARRAAEGGATGLDLSAPMLERARASARSEGLGNASFTQGDAQSHPFAPGAFDVAVSRYGVMFFADPVAAFTNIASALRPGGRLAFVCPAEADGNEWLQALAALRGILPVGEFGAPGSPGMFSLADPERAVRILSAAGWEEAEAVRVQADGDWGRDAEDAAGFLLGSGPGRHLLDQVGPEQQQLARRTLADALRPHQRDGAVRLRSSSWLVTARRPATR